MMVDIPQMPMSYEPGGMVQYGNDERLYVRFSRETRVNAAASREAGRPISEAYDMVHIQQPGERDCIRRPVTEMDQRRFPKQWDAYLKGRGDEVNGTLLAVVFPDNPEIVENLRSLKIMTAEQLASCSDTQIQNIGLGGRQMVERAKAFMGHAEKGKGLAELNKRLDDLELKGMEKDDRIKALESALADAQRQLEGTKTNRGRAA